MNPPLWGWIIFVWALLSGLFAWLVSRWFRYLRDGD